MTRGRKSILTFGSGSVLAVVTMVVGLIAAPFILGWLGDERYGAFRTAVDWFAYLSLLELGLAGALFPLFAKAFGRNDDDAVRRTLAAGIRAYGRVTFFMIAGALVLVAAITRLIPISDANAADLTRASLVATIGLLLTPFIPFRSMTEARQRGYLVNTLLVVQSLFVTAIALLLAYRGWGVAGQFVALVLGGVLFFGVLTFREFSQGRGITGADLRSAARTEEWNQLWALNRPTLISQVCGRLSLVSDHTVVALILGPAAVAPLYLTRRLSDLALGQLQGIGNASWAALADLHAVGDHTTFSQRLVEATKLVAALGVAVLVPIAVHNGRFVELWVGSRHYAGFAVTATVACNAFLLGLITLWDWAFSGTGQVAKMVPVSVVSTTINLAVSVILTFRIGILGPLVGTLVATLATSAWYVPVLMGRTFDIHPARIARAVALPVAWGVPYALAAWWVARITPDIGWVGLIGEMGIAVVVYLGVWWTMILDPTERAVYAGRIKTFVRGTP